MARCVERSNVFCPGMSQPTLPKIRVDTRFSEDRGVEVFPTFRPADWFWAKHKSNRRTRKGLEKDEGVQGEMTIIYRI